MNESQATTSQISTLVLKDMAVGHIYTRGQWVTVGPTWAIGPMQSEESGKWPHHRLGIWSQEEASSKSPAPDGSGCQLRDYLFLNTNISMAQGVNEDAQVASVAWVPTKPVGSRQSRKLYKQTRSGSDGDDPACIITTSDGQLRTRLLRKMLLQSWGD